MTQPREVTFYSFRLQTIGQARRLHKWLFYYLLALLPLSGVCQAQDGTRTFTSTDRELSFSYSATLIEQQVELPQAVVALRDPTSGYPSFNILASAESYDPATINESAYREKIINDYRAVGITDATSVRNYTSPVAGMNVHTSELRYRFKDQVLIAAVTLVPAGSGKHYILTYLDLADQFYRRKVIREEMVNSLKLLSAQAASAPSTSSQSPASKLPYWVMPLILLGIVLAAGIIAFRRRAKSGTP